MIRAIKGTLESTRRSEEVAVIGSDSIRGKQIGPQQPHYPHSITKTAHARICTQCLPLQQVVIMESYTICFSFKCLLNFLCPQCLLSQLSFVPPSSSIASASFPPPALIFPSAFPALVLDHSSSAKCSQRILLADVTNVGDSQPNTIR